MRKKQLFCPLRGCYEVNLNATCLAEIVQLRILWWGVADNLSCPLGFSVNYLLNEIEVVLALSLLALCKWKRFGISNFFATCLYGCGVGGKWTTLKNSRTHLTPHPSRFLLIIVCCDPALSQVIQIVSKLLLLLQVKFINLGRVRGKKGVLSYCVRN